MIIPGPIQVRCTHQIWSHWGEMACFWIILMSNPFAHHQEHHYSLDFIQYTLGDKYYL